jgi:hypothetical protein
MTGTAPDTYDTFETILTIVSVPEDRGANDIRSRHRPISLDVRLTLR